MTQQALTRTTLGSLVAAFAIFGGAPQQAPVASILGTWHGTSTCLDHVKDPYCHDEVVIYDVDTISTPPGTVNLKADKVVNGVRDTMGTLRFVYQPSTRTWTSEFTSPRAHALWSFSIDGNTMSGYLLELPGRRQVRRVSVKRAS